MRNSSACAAAVILLALPCPADAAPAVTVAVRSGDAAPVTGRVPRAFGGRLAVDRSGQLCFFRDRAGTALFLEAGGVVRSVARVGDAQAGSAFQSFGDLAAGVDGSLAFQAGLADGHQGLFRIPAGAAVPEPIVLDGTVIGLPLQGPAAITALSAPAVDGAGRVAAAIDFGGGRAAVIRFSAGSPPDVLLEGGAAVAGSLFLRAPVAPAAAPNGALALIAALANGAEAVLRLDPGLPATTLFTTAGLPPSPAPAVALAPPAINDAGTVAFLWSLGGVVRLQRIENGTGLTLAAPGSSAPGGDSFDAVTDLPPAIDASGTVLFAAYRSSGAGGLYLFRDQPVALAEEGMPDGSGGTLQALDLYPPQAAPAMTPGGEAVFAVADTLGTAIDAGWPGIPILTRARGGSLLAEPARFVSFIEAPFPSLGGGPFLSAGGTVLFDARLTNGGRGLFRRDRAGALLAVAGDGDEAPGGGHFDGRYFAYHSINDAGVAAFLGAAPDTPAGSGLVLYYGGGAAGPPARLLGVGDLLPWSASQVSGFLPPSPVNAAGALAVPVVLADATAFLVGFDGARLLRVAGTGDPLPGGGAIVSFLTGASRTRALLPPLLDDGGRIVVGLGLDDGRRALYELPLAEDAAALATRLLGLDDPVEGGRLNPFEIQGLDRDASGRLVFQATYDATRQYATFLDEGGVPGAVARPQDGIPGFGTITSVVPHLALAGDGRMVHAVLRADGAEALLLRTPAVPAPETSILVASGEAIAGIGTVRRFQSPTVPPAPTARLASTHGGLLAVAAGATAGPEALLLYDLNPNAAPIAAAGADQVIECTGPDGAAVTLDGGGSWDPDLEPIDSTWRGPFGSVAGPIATVTLPLGAWTMTLTVRDARGATATDSMTVVVRDTRSPALELAATPAILWPPNKEMRPVELEVSMIDVCDPAPRGILRGVVILDPGGADRNADVSGAALGTDDRSLLLRAKRSAGSGRIYSIVYLTIDASGNPVVRTSLVRVPRNQGHLR